MCPCPSLDLGLVWFNFGFGFGWIAATYCWQHHAALSQLFVSIQPLYDGQLCILRLHITRTIAEYITARRAGQVRVSINLPH